MFVLAFMTVVSLHTAPSPALQLAALQRVVPFRLLVLPASAQLLRAEANRVADADVGARIEYSIEGPVVEIDERLPTEADALANSAPHGQLYNIDGYPAVVNEAEAGYRHLTSLTWYRPDLTVTISSRDNRVSAPLLLDAALELR